MFVDVVGGVWGSADRFHFGSHSQLRPFIPLLAGILADGWIHVSSAKIGVSADVFDSE